MKRIKLLAAFIMAFFAIGITSCDVEPVDNELLNNPQPPANPNNPGTPTTPNGPATFTVDFNNQTFVATSVYAQITDGLMGIQGMRGANGEAVSIAMPADGVGTYSAEDLLMNYSPNDNDEYGWSNLEIISQQSSGTVTITEIDEVNHTISGTFSFTGWYGDENAGVAPIVFTNGAFNDIPYVTDNPVDTDEFAATVNDAPYDVENIVTATVDAGAGMTININVLDADLNNLAIAIKNELPVGTYNFNGFGPDFDITGSITLDDVEYVATSGSLTITQKTATLIAGTFTFTATNGEGGTVTVTGGSFSVTYEE